MPTIPTIKPADPQAAGFRALASYLEAQSRGYVKRFVSWSGTANDAAPPSTGQLPWVRLSPLAAPAAPRASQGPAFRRGYECPMRVLCELAVPGSLVDDLPSLWGRLESALFPDPDGAGGRSVLLDRLAPFGVRDIRLSQRGLPDSPASFSAEMVTGTAEILLVFELAV